MPVLAAAGHGPGGKSRCQKLSFCHPSIEARMQPRRPILRALTASSFVLAALSFVACGGGGSVAGGQITPCTSAGTGNGTTPPSGTFCLISCNLGCNLSGCGVSEIAQNQSLTFQFSHEVDPSSVNSASLSLKTPTGDEPVGQYLVNKDIVQFVPEVRIVGASNFFGFRANDTYRLTINGGTNNVNAVRSTSGTSLFASFSCTVNVSRGVVDQDGQPPQAKLITPSHLTNVPLDTQIVIEFSELIDASSFQTGANPVVFALRKTRNVGSTTERECNPNAPSSPLPGQSRISNDPVRGITILTFHPADTLPGSICVEIAVTNQLKDLSGTPSQGQAFSFVTIPSPSGEKKIPEEFDTDAKLDKDNSSGTWGGGLARPGVIGATGIDGDFSLSTPGLEDLGGNRFLFRTTAEQVGSLEKFVEIPADRSYLNKAHQIRDGRVEFSNFVLPKNTTLEFKGTVPPRISVRGKFDIQGKLFLSGGSITAPWTTPTPIAGRAGGLGGCFGGNGGKGGDAGNGTGHVVAYDGSAGENIRLPSGHAYASRLPNTGGKGSVQFPLSGLASAITKEGISGAICDQVCAGGGGGGYDQAGGFGRAYYTLSSKPGNCGPDSVGGVAFDNFPLPPSTSSMDHFLIGGSGGGGAGSCPYFNSSNPPAYNSGDGGAGGGGAIGLRGGSALTIGTSGSIEAAGGWGFQTLVLNNLPGGGGGSGGSILLQIAGSITQQGLLTVGGGLGGSVIYTAYPIKVLGGNGSDGYIRLETLQTPSAGLLGNCTPAASARNVASLTETDTKVGCQSLWYMTGEIFAPEFLRYEIKATVNGLPKTFSDDPSLSFPLAKEGEDLEFYVQGANLDNVGKVLPGQSSEWLKFVGTFATNGGARSPQRRELHELSLPARIQPHRWQGHHRRQHHALLQVLTPARRTAPPSCATLSPALTNRSRNACTLMPCE
jgi:hypothetical protein